MNNIFRNIKENDDLDKLEESDDEEEFEDISIDKYVFLNKKKKWSVFIIIDLKDGFQKI